MKISQTVLITALISPARQERLDTIATPCSSTSVFCICFTCLCELFCTYIFWFVRIFCTRACMRAFLITFISRLGDSPQSIALRLSRTGSWSLGNTWCTLYYVSALTKLQRDQTSFETTVHRYEIIFSLQLVTCAQISLY